MAAMWAQFVDTSRIYSEVVKEARRFGYLGGCPVAESVADRLITLPNHAALTGQDIDNVARSFLPTCMPAGTRSTARYFMRSRRILTCQSNLTMSANNLSAAW